MILYGIKMRNWQSITFSICKIDLSAHFNQGSSLFEDNHCDRAIASEMHMNI